MATDRFEKAVANATAKRHARLAEDLLGQREDAGVSRRQLAAASGVDVRYLARIEAGRESPSLATYQRLAAALGADLHARIYPNTGPSLRDRHSARMLETLLEPLHARWQRYTELGVTRPHRGWIDLGLHDPIGHQFVASELQSELRRLEQLVRWHAAKAESLPSWEGWPHLGPEPAISRLLVVRRTRTTLAVARDVARQLRVAYPAHPDDALAALVGTAPWPGPAIVWIVLDGARSRIAGGRVV